MKITGIDSSQNQIQFAKRLSEKATQSIDDECVKAENAEFSDGSFDYITACQCFTYFEHEKLAPQLYHMLKPHGRFVILYMAWLPDEDQIAGMSENLILNYNPLWTGCREKRHTIEIPLVYRDYFSCCE